MKKIQENPSYGVATDVFWDIGNEVQENPSYGVAIADVSCRKGNEINANGVATDASRSLHNEEIDSPSTQQATEGGTYYEVVDPQH